MAKAGPPIIAGAHESEFKKSREQRKARREAQYCGRLAALGQRSRQSFSRRIQRPEMLQEVQVAILPSGIV